MSREAMIISAALNALLRYVETGIDYADAEDRVRVEHQLTDAQTKRLRDTYDKV